MIELAILGKLRRELAQDISTERQVVDILVEIRKIIELTDETRRHGTLYFYCSWAVHTRMTKAVAGRMLQTFDEAYPLLRDRELHQLPMYREIVGMIDMKCFRQQLKDFLAKYELDSTVVAERWTAFLRLYASVIEDCPLTAKDENKEFKNIKKVVLSLDNAPKKIQGVGEDHLVYRLRWLSYGKNDLTGEIATYFTIP